MDRNDTHISGYIPPDDAIASLARRLYPEILAYFESEQGQKEFEEWKRQRTGVENDVISSDEE